MFVRVRVSQTVPLPRVNLKKKNINIVDITGTALLMVSPVIDKVCRA